METRQFDEALVPVAMEMILHAGDARLSVTEAFALIAEADFAAAAEKLESAKVRLGKAHNLQTDIVQSEHDGQKREAPLLFLHAQDTLMTVFSEYLIARQMKTVMERYEARLSALERPPEGG